MYTRHVLRDIWIKCSVTIAWIQMSFTRWWLKGTRFWRPKCLLCGAASPYTWLMKKQSASCSDQSRWVQHCGRGGEVVFDHVRGWNCIIVCGVTLWNLSAGECATDVWGTGEDSHTVLLYWRPVHYLMPITGPGTEIVEIVTEECDYKLWLCSYRCR